MSNNKFWQKKDSNVQSISDNAELENTTTQSLTDEEPKIGFDTTEIEALIKVREKQLLHDVLQMMREHKYNMLDTITRAESEKVAKWLEEKLQKDGKL